MILNTQKKDAEKGCSEKDESASNKVHCLLVQRGTTSHEHVTLFPSEDYNIVIFLSEAQQVAQMQVMAQKHLQKFLKKMRHRQPYFLFLLLV